MLAYEKNGKTQQGAKRATCGAALPKGGPEGLRRPREPPITSLAPMRRASSMTAGAGWLCSSRA